MPFFNLTRLNPVNNFFFQDKISVEPVKSSKMSTLVHTITVEHGRMIIQKAPPLWRSSRRRRQLRVTIGCLVAGSIPGRAYVKEIPSTEHKKQQQSVMGCRVCQLILQKHTTY